MTTRIADTASLTAQAAALSVFGTAEAASAMVGLALDQQRNASREAERRAEKAQRAAAEAELEHMRSASVLKLAGSMGSALANGASAGFEMQGLCVANATKDADVANAATKAAEVASKFSEASGQAVGAAFSFASSEAETDAKASSFEREGHRDAVQAERDAQSALRQMSDKAASHLDAISRARAEAMMAAARG